MDQPKQRGCTFDGMACLPSPWLLWAIRRCRRAESEAPQGALVRDFSRTSSTSSTSTILINEKQLFTVSKGARLPPRLELRDPSAQLPLDHVLTSAFSCPHRSLDRRCLRHRRPPFDWQRSWARYYAHYRRRRSLHGLRRRHERGTLYSSPVTAAPNRHRLHTVFSLC